VGPQAGGDLNGAAAICAALRELGARTVFGLPGTQNAVLYDAMRRAGLRSVVASDEAAAAFMACGYARAAGTVGVLTTIPGPGFVYALAGWSSQDLVDSDGERALPERGSPCPPSGALAESGRLTGSSMRIGSNTASR